jgi:hypothetical protein
MEAIALIFGAGLSVETGQLIALIIGVFGVCGVIFTAMRYNRDDTTAIVNQQTQITGEMKVLNDELRITVTTLRTERDECRAELQGVRRG